MKAFVLAALLALPASAGVADEAQKRYDSGDYAGAAASYAALAKESAREPSWHYDLGNARFKSGKLGPAVASYLRAYELAPRDADIRYNLSFALRRAGEELEPEGVPPFLHRLYRLLSASELAGLHWLFCWATLLLGTLRLLKPERREGLAPWLAGCAAAWAIVGLWWGARLATAPRAVGVVVASTAEVRSGPGDKFSVGVAVPEGRRLEILSRSGDWLEVGVLKEGAKGWVLSSSVEAL